MRAKIIGRAAALTTAMAIAMAEMPVSAYTVDEQGVSFTFSDKAITASGGSGYKIEGTDLTITAGGTYTVSGECAEGSITIKKGTTGVVLVLDGITLSSSESAPLSINKNAEATLVIKNSNTLVDAEDPADENSTDETVAEAFDGAGIKVKSGSSLTVVGDGSLTVDGSDCKNGIKGGSESVVTIGEDETDSFKLNVSAANNALTADGVVTINGGEITLNSSDDGLVASPDDDDEVSKGQISVNGGDITITAKDDAVHGKNVEITDGVMKISAGDDGIKAEYGLTIGTDDGSGPDITVSKSYEGLEGATIVLKGGKGSIISSDDGINAGNGDLTNYSFSLDITGGEWHINADGDGLDSNGNISMSGGFVEVFGAANNGNGALDIGDRGCSLTYTGGTLAAIGMNGMAVTPTTGSYLVFGGSSGGSTMPGGQSRGRNGQSGQSTSTFTISKGDKVEIRDSKGNTVYSTTAQKSANHVVFADDDLSSSETYTLYINDKSVGTATLSTGSGQSSQQPGGEQPGGEEPGGEQPGDMPQSGGVSVEYVDNMGNDMTGLVLTFTDETGRSMTAQVADGKANVMLIPGSYTVLAEKDGYVSRTYTDVDINMESVVSVELHVLGDVNGDGEAFKANDLAAASSHVKSVAILSSYAEACADLNNDGSCTAGDLTTMTDVVKGLRVM